MTDISDIRHRVLLLDTLRQMPFNTNRVIEILEGLHKLNPVTFQRMLMYQGVNKYDWPDKQIILEVWLQNHFLIFGGPTRHKDAHSNVRILSITTGRQETVWFDKETSMDQIVSKVSTLCADSTETLAMDLRVQHLELRLLDELFVAWLNTAPVGEYTGQSNNLYNYFYCYGRQFMGKAKTISVTINEQSYQTLKVRFHLYGHTKFFPGPMCCCNFKDTEYLALPPCLVAPMMPKVHEFAQKHLSRDDIFTQIHVTKDHSVFLSFVHQDRAFMVSFEITQPRWDEAWPKTMTQSGK
jgi:hypothetical protein